MTSNSGLTNFDANSISDVQLSSFVNLSIACDFDGTITTVDTTELTLRRFAPGKWEMFDDLLKEGKISLEECMIGQLKLIKAPKEDIVRLIDGAIGLRPGVGEFIDYCKIKGIEFTILSAGLDFYIDHVISKYGWSNVKRISGTTKMDDGLSVEFPKHRFPDSKTFKDDFVRFQKELKKTVWYFGDGNSDKEGALAADVVFSVAGSSLSQILVEKGKIHRDFQDFSTVLTILKNSLS
jgi:2-hydroxy-3-keto-5-methylthiopentenyl-1-phosphate phosphatase